MGYADANPSYGGAGFSGVLSVNQVNGEQDRLMAKARTCTYTIDTMYIPYLKELTKRVW